MWLWAALISLGGTAVAVYQNRVVFLALAGWLVLTVGADRGGARAWSGRRGATTTTTPRRRHDAERWCGR